MTNAIDQPIVTTIFNHPRDIGVLMIRSKSRKELDQILKSIKDILSENYRDKLDNILLFGSYARNSQRNESDIDIAVVLDGEFDKYEEVEKMVDLTNDISLKYDVMISILPMTNKEYLNGNYSIFKNIRQEEIVI